MRTLALRWITLLLATALSVFGNIAPANAAVAACGIPGITGSARVGVTLTVTATCSNTPTSYAFQWTSSATSGGTYTALHSTSGAANTSSYSVQPSDAGMYIKVSVVATNSSGSSAPATSSSTGPYVFTAEPFVGSATVGDLDGLGTAARFKYISAIVSDGNFLYVSDEDARKIKKIDAIGNVTTIAGSGSATPVDGIGTAAAFAAPTGMAYDSTNNSLLVKDASVIREINLNTLQVTTLQNRQTILSVSKSGTVVTLTFAKPHGFSTQSVTIAGLGAPYDGTFTTSGVYTNTFNYSVAISGTVASFNPTGATATGDLGPSRTYDQTWGHFYEAFQIASDGNIYLGRGNYGGGYDQSYLLRLVRVSGSIFRYERLRSFSLAPCALAFVSPTDVFMNTCGSLIRTTTSDDWATVSTTLVASSNNSGVFFDPVGYAYYDTKRYNLATSATSTVLASPTHQAGIWEMLGDTLYIADDYGSMITRYVGAGSGQAISYVAPNYSVTFNANGGSGTMSTQTSNAAATLTSNAFTLNGSSFAGWNTAANGSGTSYADQANYSFSANMTLYAQWTSSAQVQNIPVIANDISFVTAWTQPRATLGGTVRVALKGYELQRVSSVQSSSGKARIVRQGEDILDVEISEALLGIGWIKLTSSGQVLTIQDAFSIVSAETNASGVQPSKQLNISFAANTSTLSAEAKRQLIAQLKKIANPKRLVITGSVATDRSSLATRSLALLRAKAVAGVITKVFANVKPTLRVADARGQATLHDNVTVEVTVLTSKQ